jgi:hypothetical protein
MFFPLGLSCHRAGGIRNLPPIKANDSRFRSTDLLQCRLAVVETVNKLAPLPLIEKMLRGLRAAEFRQIPYSSPDSQAPRELGKTEFRDGHPTASQLKSLFG